MSAILPKFVELVRLYFKKYPFLFYLILIFLICLLAYGKITGMYFFLEDYLTIYSLQHPDASRVKLGESVLFFGYPNGYEITPFIPFFPLFDINPYGYYLIEVILYFLAALTVFIFARTLTGQNLVALGSSFIFASGYVGSDSLYRIAIGWQNIMAAIFISLTATFYFKYIKTKNLKIYLLALFFYLFTSDFSFYRSHGIVLLILGMEVLFNFNKIYSIVRIIPFVLGYWYFYIYSVRTIMDQGSKSIVFIQKIFDQGNYQYLLTPFKTLENLFIPDTFGFPLLVFIAILIGVMLWRRSKLLLYCLIFAAANYLVYFYTSPESPQETTHRYLTISFVGVAMFWGIFISGIVKNTYHFLFLCLLIVVLNLTLVRQEQLNILQNRSQPSYNFWQSFQSQVSNLSKQSVIFINSKLDGKSKPARDAAIGAGSMSATTTFAVHYGLKWEDIVLAENFSELLWLVKTNKVDPANVYTFFYSREGGLINTTDHTKAIFGEDLQEVNVKDLNNINLLAVTPMLIHFSTNSKLDLTNINYSAEKTDLDKYLSYLTTKNRYYQIVSASATSQVKYAAVKNIIDKKNDSSWRGDDIYWSKNHDVELTVDLSEAKKIGAVKITPGILARVPEKYLYQCSLNGKEWKLIKEVEKEVKKTGTFVDKFDEANCAYLKIIILKTVMDGPPQISELEVIDSQFSEINFDLADKIETNPFLFLSSASDKDLLVNYINQNGINSKICIYSDKNREANPICDSIRIKIGSDNSSFLIDQVGTKLHKIEIITPSQVRLIVTNAKLQTLTFNQLDKMGYISQYGD